jgi:DNA-directed RNA polymerase sigma subunit (sigma70/sigma32)
MDTNMRQPLTLDQILTADLTGLEAIVLFLRYGYDRAGKVRALDEVAKLVDTNMIALRFVEQSAYRTASGAES